MKNVVEVKNVVKSFKDKIEYNGWASPSNTVK